MKVIHTSKRIISSVIAAVLTFMFFTTGFAAGEDAGITDEKLKTALLNPPINVDTDGNGEISEDELAALSGSIDLSSSGISDITGLEYAVGIESLNLSDNIIRDLTPLTQLKLHADPTAFTSLDVSQNYLDISEGSDDKNDIVTLQEAGCTVTHDSQKSIPVNSVAIYKETETVDTVEMYLGDTLGLNAVVSPADAADQSVSWTTSNTKIATVSEGVVTAVAVGEATVTVTTTDGGHIANCQVSVKNKPVGSVALENSVELCPGDTLGLTPVVLPEDAADKSVSWTSSNTEIVTISDGVVTAVAAGTASITVTTTDGGYTAQCTVNVLPGTITSGKYSIHEEKLWFASEGTSVADLITAINNDAKYLSVHDADGSVYTGESVGTGMILRLTAAGKVRQEVTILTRGDANGDGKISITDYTLLRLHILNIKALTGVYTLAVDLNADSALSITDYTTERLHILGIKPIAELYKPIDPEKSVDPNNPNDPEYLNTISNPTIRRFIEIALAQQGEPYVWGAEGPDSFDCSGFAYYCLKQAGYGPLYRTTALSYSDYYFHEGTSTTKRWPWEFIAKEDLQPGDLMFYKSDPFDNNRPIGHIGIYLGNGYHIHASSTYEQVIVCQFDGWYDEFFYYGRRVNW